MDTNARARTIASTQDHLEIKEIVDDLIITKNGSAAMVIQTSAINFDLLAEYEQDSKIFAFAGLLNSLNFHIQILIRTRRIDISNYVSYLKNQGNRDITPGLRKQLDIYTQFIQKLTIENDVLDKNFLLVITYNPGGSMPTSNILKSKKSNQEIEQNTQMKQSQLLEKAKIFLYPKRDYILKQLNRMGLGGKQLTTKELITEFYTIYNPEEERGE
jgi:hypothetical protein